MEKVELDNDGVDSRPSESAISLKKFDLVPEIGALIVLSFVAGLCSESESLIPSINVGMFFLMIPVRGLLVKQASAPVWLVSLVACGCTMALVSRYL